MLTVTFTDPSVVAFCRDNSHFDPEVALGHTIQLLKSLSRDNASDLSSLVSGHFTKLATDLVRARESADMAIVSRLEQSMRCADQAVYDKLSALESAVHNPIGVRADLDHLKATISRLVHDTSSIHDLKTALQSVHDRIESTQVLDEHKTRNLAMHIEQCIANGIQSAPKLASIEQALTTCMTSSIPCMLSAELAGLSSALAGIQVNTAGMGDIARCLQTISDKLGAPSSKGTSAEEMTMVSLEKLFPTHIITRVASCNQVGQADIVMDKPGLPRILVEVKLYKSTVGTAEVAKFERDVALAKTHGVFISQASRIQGKHHFHVDVIAGQYVVVYLSNVQFAEEPLMSAVTLIYELAGLLAHDESGTVRLDPEALAQLSSVLDAMQASLTEIERGLKDTLAKTRAMSLSQIRGILGLCGTTSSNGNHVCPRCSKEFKLERNLAAHIVKCK